MGDVHDRIVVCYSRRLFNPIHLSFFFCVKKKTYKHENKVIGTLTLVVYRSSLLCLLLVVQFIQKTQLRGALENTILLQCLKPSTYLRLRNRQKQKKANSEVKVFRIVVLVVKAFPRIHSVVSICTRNIRPCSAILHVTHHTKTQHNRLSIVLKLLLFIMK